MKTMQRGFKGKIRVRIVRPWRGYRPGDEISPPAALRQELLRQKDPIGRPVAELVDEKAKVPGSISTPAAPAAAASVHKKARQVKGKSGGRKD